MAVQSTPPIQISQDTFSFPLNQVQLVFFHQKHSFIQLKNISKTDKRQQKTDKKYQNQNEIHFYYINYG